jgi:aryl-alcohol dehydrogenase-like predicted oxidoreductase
MKRRPLGRTGLLVSEIGFGGSRIGGLMSRGSTDSGVATLHAAFDAGINFFDTADMYSQGEGEALIGRAFRDRRDQVIIATKGGYLLPARRHLLAKIKPLVRPVVRWLGIKREHLGGGIAGQLSQDFSASYITQALDASLKRLQTDYIDVYQLHSPSPADIATDGFLETVHTLEKLRKDGKIRSFGFAADTLEYADAGVRRRVPDCVQGPYGLLDPDSHGLLDAWQSHTLGVIARGCFGGGLLKESLTEAELRERTPKADAILGLRRMAAEHQRSTLELAVQFCLRTPGIGVMLLGMRTVEHVRQNLRYYDTPPLSDGEFAQCLTLAAAVPQPSDAT